MGKNIPEILGMIESGCVEAGISFVASDQGLRFRHTNLLCLQNTRQVSGHDLAVARREQHERGLRSRAVRASKKHFLAPQARRAAAPPSPGDPSTRGFRVLGGSRVWLDGTQRSGARIKFCTEAWPILPAFLCVSEVLGFQFGDFANSCPFAFIRG